MNQFVRIDISLDLEKTRNFSEWSQTIGFEWLIYATSDINQTVVYVDVLGAKGHLAANKYGETPIGNSVCSWDLATDDEKREKRGGFPTGVVAGISGWWVVGGCLPCWILCVCNRIYTKWVKVLRCQFWQGAV